MRHSLFALCALAVPAVVPAQVNWGTPAPMPPQPPAAVAEPWMAQPAPAQQQPWQSPAARPGQSAALEPIDLPPAIEQGVDMIYVDQDLVPKAVQDQRLLHDISFDAWSGAPVDLFVSVNPIYTDLRRGLVKYRQRWGDLPQVTVPDGPALKPGSTGDRVA